MESHRESHRMMPKKNETKTDGTLIEISAKNVPRGSMLFFPEGKWEEVKSVLRASDGSVSISHKGHGDTDVSFEFSNDERLLVLVYEPIKLPSDACGEKWFYSEEVVRSKKRP